MIPRILDIRIKNRPLIGNKLPTSESENLVNIVFYANTSHFKN